MEQEPMAKNSNRAPEPEKSTEETVSSKEGEVHSGPGQEGKPLVAASSIAPVGADEYRMAAHFAVFEHCDPERAVQLELLARQVERYGRILVDELDPGPLCQQGDPARPRRAHKRADT